MPDLKLTEIWIYPIKSLGGIPLLSAKVMEKGLQYDRRWMLVDSDGRFMTQRIHPAMALFKLKIDSTQLTINHKGDFMTLSLNHLTPSISLDVQIWDDTVKAFEVSTEHSRWFSERLGIDCRLVHFPEENERPVDPLYKVNNEHVSLADAYPFLIIGESTLADLNTRLSQSVPMNRFRPNLVFTGGEPYEEDTWRNFSIGATRFVGVKPCARCVLPTVNQETGEKGDEPLRTLSTYRKTGNKIYFGQNLIALDLTEVRVGDKITLKNS